MEVHNPQRTGGVPDYVPVGVSAVVTIACGAAGFGEYGALIGSLVAAVWIYVLLSNMGSRALLHATLAVVVLGLIAVFCLTPAVSRAREPARFTQCRNNMKQIGLALHNYHDEYGSFPPVCTVDAAGRPMHSWRVLILRYLDQARLYEQFRFDEPWNSPHNITLAQKIPDVYRCPSRPGPPVHPEDCTTYVAVVGEGTAWQQGHATQLSDVTDGAERTIVLMESYAHIPWTEPRDLSMEKALAQLSSTERTASGGHQVESWLFEDFYGRTLLFADGSVASSGRKVGSDEWEALLVLNDSAPAGWTKPKWPESRTRTPRLGNWILLFVFLIAALLPVPWVSCMHARSANAKTQ